MKIIKIILLNMVLFQCSVTSFCQSKNTFLSEVEENKNRKIDSLITFNTDKDKLQFLSILPSVNYNFLENNFNVGISISNLSTYYQNKQRNKIELEKLRFQLIEKKENDLLRLEQEYELIMDTYDILKLEIENTNLTTEIFNLKKKQYENNKITLEEWLNVKKNDQDRYLEIFSKRKSLTSKMKHYQSKIKMFCFKKEIEYLAVK